MIDRRRYKPMVFRKIGRKVPTLKTNTRKTNMPLIREGMKEGVPKFLLSKKILDAEAGEGFNSVSIQNCH